MRFMVMGKRWTLVWVAKGASFVARRVGGKEQRMSKTDDGMTEAPWFKNKRVFLRHGLRGKRRLETAIHEFTHAADWSKDEEWVSHFGRDLANFLYTLGVRFTEESDIGLKDKPAKPGPDKPGKPDTLEG